MPRAPSSKRAQPIKGGKRGDPLQKPSSDFSQQLRDDALAHKYGLVSAPGRRSKVARTKRGDDDDDEAAAQRAQLTRHDPVRGFVTGAKANAAASTSAVAAGKNFVDPKLSRNILRIAREQQEEIEREDAEASRPAGAAKDYAGSSKGPRVSEAYDMPEDDDDEEVQEREGAASDEDLEDDGEELEEEYVELGFDIDPEDAELLERFGGGDGLDMGGPGGAPPTGAESTMESRNRSLADMILDKIDQAETEGAAAQRSSDRREAQPQQEVGMPPGINPKVIEVYTKVGDLLSRYKSGPLPKAFKIIPSLPSWEAVLYITDPSRWSAHATLAATRIFVSNLKAAQSQRFFRLVLLDRFRDEVHEEKKCSYQIYEALKKALYKPAAFFKGLLFPLCESGTLTLKESAILASVLSKISIPVLHSAAALQRLASMEYTGPTSLLIRVLLDKKYALPYKVVDALVFHFLRFADPEAGVEVVKGAERREDGTRERRMPVLWHQSFLVFAQRYKQDLTPDQRTALIDLLRVQRHDGIGPDIRRELTTGQARGEMRDEPLDGADSDDEMSV